MSDGNFSKALSQIPYGFFTLTTRNGDDRNAMVVNWVTQVSFEPQHIAVGLQNSSYSMGLIQETNKFAINLYANTDTESIKAFSKPRAKNPEKFVDAKYADGAVTGMPILDNASAYLECEVTQIVDTGSGHSVIIAKVIGGDARTEGDATNTLSLQDIGWGYSG